MIVGLKLTITGEEVRALLQQRAQQHLMRAECWKRERDKSGEHQSEDAFLCSEDMCENEAERHEWRADVLEFIRDHVDPREAYQLGEADLIFGELLPEKPAWLDQQEWEDRTSVGFNLGQLTKRLGVSWPMALASVETAPEDSQP
jgi:hypothetical protein